MTASMAMASREFSDGCRRWRRHRKLSQLELALSAGVSQRHVSWLETGRSQPSREMVIRLSEAMEIPLRERNVLLQSAGYAAAYAEKGLDEPGMEPVFDAVRHILEHHEPYPAVAVDRFWNVKTQNQASRVLFRLTGDPEAMVDRSGEAGESNLALLSLHPKGLRPFIANWESVAGSFIRRLRSEALASGDALMHERFEQFIELAGPVGEEPWTPEGLLPVIPLEFKLGDLDLSMFSVITTIGTPQDVTADELRIEAFFPADEPTEAFFRRPPP